MAGTTWLVVDWTDPSNGFNNYTLELNYNATFSVSPNTNLYNVTGLTPGTSYYVSVIAGNSVGISPVTLYRQTNTLDATVPGTATNFFGSVIVDEVELVWTAPNVTGGKIS